MMEERRREKRKSVCVCGNVRANGGRTEEMTLMTLKWRRYDK